MDPRDVTPVELGVMLSRLAPTHALVAAARAAVDISAGRVEAAADHRDVGQAVGDGLRDRGEGVVSEQQMWATRAAVHDAAEEAALTAEADTTDFAARRYLNDAADRAAAAAAECRSHTEPLPPAPREPAGAERAAATTAALTMAHAWIAEREEAEHRRYDDAEDDSPASISADGAA